MSRTIRRAWVFLSLATALCTLSIQAPARAAFPGGNGRIFFDTNKYPNPVTQIYSARSDGGGIHQLTHLRRGRMASQPSVSADGRWVVFVVGREGENDQLWMMRRDGTDVHPITAEPLWTHETPAFTPDGQRVVFSRCGQYVTAYLTCRIVSIATDGSDRKVIVGGLWHPGEVAVSPDGGTIAYVSDKGGFDARLWLVNADGTGAHVIASGFKVAERPTWSPDGSAIAFGAVTHDIDLYRVDADGTHLQRLATGSTFPSWSPNGSWIAFFNEGAQQVDVIRPDGTDAHRLVRPALDQGFGDSDWGVKQ